MVENKIKSIFREAQAIMKGHFLLPSGHHTSEYWNKIIVFQDPKKTETLGSLIIENCENTDIDFVAGPTVGGALLAYEVARQLDCKAIYLEKNTSGESISLSRCGQLEAGASVLLIDDVISTGNTISMSIQALEKSKLSIIGVIVLIDRRPGTIQYTHDHISKEIRSILKIDFPKNVLEQNCTLCKKGLPLVDIKSKISEPSSKFLSDIQQT